MDRNEKKRRREFIGEHLDVSGTRLNDDETRMLCDYIENFADDYSGQSETRRTTTKGFDRGDTYRRTVECTTTFKGDMSIREVCQVSYDDGQIDDPTMVIIKDARGIVNRLKGR